MSNLWNLVVTYVFIRELFPTPPSPRRITLKSDDFPAILNLKSFDFRSLICSVQASSLSLGLLGRLTQTLGAGGGEEIHRCAKLIIGVQEVSPGHPEDVWESPAGLSRCKEESKRVGDPTGWTRWRCFSGPNSSCSCPASGEQHQATIS